MAGHGHGHGHGHEPTQSGAFAWATGLNVAFVGIELTAGWLTNSTALLADAVHNLTDVLGLVLAWAASALTQRRPSITRTYGLRKTTVLATLANASLLLVSVFIVAHEAFDRLAAPQAIAGAQVMVVAGVGVLINGISALLFFQHARSDANVRGAFLHLVLDAAVSLGVVLVGGLLVLFPSWVWLDPAISLLISVVVLFGTWRLLAEALHLVVDGVPADVDAAAVRVFLEGLPKVCDVHDLHIWAMSTSETALTAHLRVEATASPDLALRAGAELGRKFGIAHTTIQLEPREAGDICHPC